MAGDACTDMPNREHPEASEVFVTGTFDDWGKTQKLDKVDGIFQKTVDLDGKEKILYKVRSRMSAHRRA
jgi:hypothetical protein